MSIVLPFKSGDETVVVQVASDGTNVAINDDGSVSIGAPAVHIPRETGDFGENLADVWGDNVLMSVGEDTLEGIDTDIASRSELISNYNKGIELLGLKIEDAANTRTQKRNVSKVGNPLLLEACVNYQSGFRGEMLPASGPAKVATIGGSDAAEDLLASDFESDFNYFLTSIDKGYYPDTDRMAFYQGFGGNAYKKVMRCPMRKMPLSRMVSLVDLIISEEADSLENAVRVTHQTYQTKGQLRRMMIAGLYRDIGLSQTSMPSLDPARNETKRAAGLAAQSSRPQDQPYQIYECDVELEPGYYGFDEDAPSDLPVPYKVTIDRTTRQVLAVWRNWKPGDEFFLKRNMYVKYGLVPGLGFHDYGFLQLLGNQTRALRAIWRLLVDAGMFANFPGGLKTKGTRQQTNEFAPGPGQWLDVDVPPNQKLTDSFMPMPYKDPSAVFIQLAEAIQSDSKRLAGAVTLDVGDGLSNVPVGTIMAAIAESTKTEAAVHKRNHTAQAEELSMLRELFVENPQDLTRLARNPARKWETAEEFQDLNLVPASDPNVPSQMHRIMLGSAMLTVANQDQAGIYDKVAVNKQAWRIAGVRDVDQYIHEPPPPGPPPPDPAMAALQMKQQQAQQKNQLDLQEQQRKAAEAEVESQTHQQEAALDLQSKREENATKLKIAGIQAQTEGVRLHVEEVRAQRQEQQPVNPPAPTGGNGA